MWFKRKWWVEKRVERRGRKKWKGWRKAELELELELVENCGIGGFLLGDSYRVGEGTTNKLAKSLRGDMSLVLRTWKEGRKKKRAFQFYPSWWALAAATQPSYFTNSPHFLICLKFFSFYFKSFIFCLKLVILLIKHPQPFIIFFFPKFSIQHC